MKFKNVKKSTAILANTGEDNLISRAKSVSGRPVLLIAPCIDVIGDDDDDDIETPSFMNNVFVPTIIYEGDDSANNQISVSELNNNNKWKVSVREEIAGVTLGVVTAEMLSESHILAIHLSSRMKSHLLNRFPNKTYWCHWCFCWAINQFSRVSLLSCMF